MTIDKMENINKLSLYLTENYPISTVILFESMARMHFDSFSDIDISCILAFVVFTFPNSC